MTFSTCTTPTYHDLPLSHPADNELSGKGGLTGKNLKYHKLWKHNIMYSLLKAVHTVKMKKKIVSQLFI